MGVVVWDSKEGVIHAAEYYLAADSYTVTAMAARINHFDENLQRQKAINPEQVVDKFSDIKEMYFSEYASLPIAGHNVAFDVQFIKQLFLSCNRSYEKMFSHRVVDTYSIIKFLSDCQLIPKSVNSSASAFKHFCIKVDGRHTALGDARATAQLFRAFCFLCALCVVPLMP